MMRIAERVLILGLASLAVSAGWIASAGASETVNYTYDVHGRLVQVRRSGTINNGVVANYSHDKADNRTNLNVSGSPNGP